MPIYFYSESESFFEFSNFSAHGFDLDGHFWPTVEHYFQAQKFVGTPSFDEIRAAKTPGQAKSMGRSRNRPLRADWEAVKIAIMRRAIFAKFAAHPDLQAMLLSTGDDELLENAPTDYFWGIGRTGTGENWCGKLVMEVRHALRHPTSPTPTPTPTAAAAGGAAETGAGGG